MLPLPLQKVWAFLLTGFGKIQRDTYKVILQNNTVSIYSDRSDISGHSESYMIYRVLLHIFFSFLQGGCKGLQIVLAA